jgi:MbtH protein
MNDGQDDTTIYRVVLTSRTLPPGWRSEGTEGLRADCLAHIGTVWTDMRPASLRRRMEQAAA